MLLCILQCEEACLTGRALCKRSAGDQEDLAVCNVLLVNVLWGDLKVCDVVAVHENAALRRALYLREGKTHALAVLCTYHLGRVDSTIVEIVQYEITERLSLAAAIESLEENDKKIINLRYYRSKTQVETAKILNMTQVQISRREKKILSLIRQKMSG